MLLDKPEVRLVSITQPVNGMAPEEFISYCARVSSPQNQSNIETAPKLLRYLISHGHWSPFEMIHVGFEVVTDRAIAAQILRHWSLHVQEFSQRYARVTDFMLHEARLQDPKNRQSSLAAPTSTEAAFSTMQAECIAHCEGLYNQALALGVAKEVARYLLPVSAVSRMYLIGSVRDWMFYLKQRLDISAQKEHREIAELIKQILLIHFPNVGEAFFTSEVAYGK